MIAAAEEQQQQHSMTEESEHISAELFSLSPSDCPTADILGCGGVSESGCSAAPLLNMPESCLSSNWHVVGRMGRYSDCLSGILNVHWTAYLACEQSVSGDGIRLMMLLNRLLWHSWDIRHGRISWPIREIEFHCIPRDITSFVWPQESRPS